MRPSLFRRSSALLLVPVLVTIFAGPAGSAQIFVRTTEDVVADDGVCSLREAVTAANTNTAANGCPAGEEGLDLIILRAGTYTLTLAPIDDDDNAGGDLDVTESLLITGVGADSTIIENGLGESDTLGDGDRILHIDPNGEVGGVDFELLELLIRNGDYGCDGAECVIGGSGIFDEGDGELRIEDVVMTGFESSCTGVDCGRESDSGTVLNKAAGRVGTLRRVEVSKNRASCADDGCDCGSIIELATESIEITDSEFVENVVTCQGLECGTDEIVDASGSGADPHELIIERSRFNQNTMECFGDRCDTDEVLDSFGGISVHRDLELSKNRQHCEGVDCDTDEVFDGPGSGVFAGFDMRRNRQTCEGDGCDTDEVFCSSGSEFRDITITKNLQSCEGDACTLDFVFDAGEGGSEGTIYENIEVKKNRVECEGAGCGSSEEAEVEIVHIDGSDIDLDAFRILKNRSSCKGDGCNAIPVVELDGGEETDRLVALDIRKNRVECEGSGCEAGEILRTTEQTDAELSGLDLRKNQVRCKGSDCDAMSVVSVAGAVGIDDSSLRKNRTDGSGTIRVEDTGTLDLTDSELRSNRAEGAVAGIENAGVVDDLTGTEFRGNKPENTECVDVDAGTGCP